MSDEPDLYASGTPELYESGSEEIPGFGPLLRLTAEELFDPNSPPVVYCTSPGNGKTIAAVAAVYANLHRATGLFYITNSYFSQRAQYLQKMIPAIHVRNFDLQFLCELWGMVQKKAAEWNKAIDQRQLDEFMDRHCARNPSYLHEVQRLRQIRVEHARELPDSPEMELATKAMLTEIGMRFIRSNFRRDDPRMSKSEQNIITACQSSEPLPIIIFDDVTAALKTPPIGSFEIPELTEHLELRLETCKGVKAMERLLIMLMTTTRQAASVSFFVHELSVFTASVRQNIGAVVLDGAGVSEICRQGVVGEEGKALIEAAWAKISNQNRFKYHRVVYYADPSTTCHGQRIAVFKPPYYSEPKPIGVPTYRFVVDAINREAEKRKIAYDMNRGARADDAMRKKAAERIASGGPPPMVAADPRRFDPLS